MDKLVVEVGLLLGEDVEKYEKVLEDNGAVNVFNCETHDLYWTNKTHRELEKLTENQIKNACVRLRICSGVGGKEFNGNYDVSMSFDNFKIYDEKKDDRFKVDMKKFKQIQKKLEDDGWYLVFDTFKRDNQYTIDDMKSRIQLQDIDTIGVLLYYDNPDYYGLDEETQRVRLIEELNSYGFDFKKEDLGVDKLRTLLLGHTCYSKNQNG